MKFRILLIFFLVTSFNQSIAGVREILSLELVGKKNFEAEPRDIVTIIYRISNNSDLNQKINVKITLPQNWKVVNPEPFYEIDGNQQNVRLMSVFIPLSAKSGNYLISYQISTQSELPILLSFTVPVFVKPIRKISLELIDKPDFVIAGDSYQMKFRLKNESNIYINARIYLTSKDSLSYHLKKQLFALAPDQSQNFFINVNTNSETEGSITNKLEVIAKLTTKEEVHSGVIGSVEVIPRILTPGQNFNTVPFYSTLRFVNQNQHSQLSGFQAEIIGKGFLNQNQTNKVNLVLRGPDIYNKSIFGKYDEYLLSNSDDKYNFHIGDRPYYLSTLTQSYRYGRGIEGQYKHNNFKLGFYSMVSRFFQPEEKVFASFLEFKEKKEYQVRVNYMKKNLGNQESDIVSVESKIEPNTNTKIQMEYALGKSQTETSQAYHLDIQSKLKNHTLFIKFIQADPNFSGYYSNVNFVSAGGAFRLNKKLRLNAGMGQRKNDTNVTLSYYFSSMIEYKRIGLSYRITSNSFLNVGWSTRSRYDQLPVSRIDDFEKNLRLEFTRVLKKINFSTSVELTKTQDNTTSKSANLQRYSTSMTYNQSSLHKFSGYLYYSNHNDPLRENKRNLTAGLRLSSRITGTTKLDLTLQSLNNLKYSSIIRDMYEIRLSQKLFNNHEISFFARHISYSQDQLTNFSALVAEYRIPFGMPVSRNNLFGSLKGIVYDIENNRPISGAVIRLNKLSTVSDKNGVFKFPSLIPGKYLLNFEQSSIGLNRVTTENFPMEILLAENEKKLIAIKLTRGASVTGKVTLYKFKEIRTVEDNLPDESKKIRVPNKQDSPYERVSGMSHLLIELTHGKTIKRRVTDRFGRFNFSELSPGEWKLTVQKSRLPEYTFVQPDTLQLLLKPGENEEIEINVLPEKRPVRIIQDGGVLLEKPVSEKKEPKETIADNKKQGKFINYTTKPGEHLSSIARKFYGNGNLYLKIYEANRDSIKNPNLIFPGKTIRIPVLK